MTNQANKRNPLWKFLPIAIAIFALLVFLAIYLGGPVEEESEELTGIISRGDIDFEWYSQYLILKDTKLEMGLNFAGNRIVMISGVVENGGDRTVDVVQVKISFFNYEELVAEEIREPVKPGRYSPPIPPLTDRAINFYIETFPEGWKSSHAEIELNGFRFLDAE